MFESVDELHIGGWDVGPHIVEVATKFVRRVTFGDDRGQTEVVFKEVTLFHAHLI